MTNTKMKLFLKNDIKHKSDIIEEKYYKFVITIFRAAQLWPYPDQNRKKSTNKFFICTLYYTLTITLIIPQLITMLLGESDQYDTLYSMTITFFHTIALSKYTAVLMSREQIRVLFDKILLDWKVITNEKERQLLATNYDFGQSFRKVYLVVGFLSWMSISTFQYTPIIADIWYDMENKSKLIVFQNAGNYIIDVDRDGLIGAIRYFHFSIISFFNCIIFFSIDIFILMTVVHICGLFDILSYKISIIKRKSNDVDDVECRCCAYLFKDLKKIVVFHTEILKNIILLENTFTYSLIIVQILCLVMLPMTLYYVYYSGNHPLLTVQAVAFSFGFIAEVFFLNVIGQKIIDASGMIYNSVYFSNWYELPTECQKFLGIIMVRSVNVSKITAGKLTILSFEAFLTIMQTIFYFFTVILSIF